MTRMVVTLTEWNPTEPSKKLQVVSPIRSTNVRLTIVDQCSGDTLDIEVNAYELIQAIKAIRGVL